MRANVTKFRVMSYVSVLSFTKIKIQDKYPLKVFVKMLTNVVRMDYKVYKISIQSVRIFALRAHYFLNVFHLLLLKRSEDHAVSPLTPLFPSISQYKPFSRPLDAIFFLLKMYRQLRQLIRLDFKTENCFELLSKFSVEFLSYNYYNFFLIRTFNLVNFKNNDYKCPELIP